MKIYIPLSSDKTGFTATDDTYFPKFISHLVQIKPDRVYTAEILSPIFISHLVQIKPEYKEDIHVWEEYLYPT